MWEGGEREYVRKWFACFKSGSFDLEDQKCFGSPSVPVDDQFRTLIENNSRQLGVSQKYSTLYISHTTVINRLKALRFINQYYVWVPYDLTEKKKLIDCISICDSLLKHNENNSFLKQLIMGDEKSILYNNVDKRSWGERNEAPLITPKVSQHLEKVMLCIWWDWKGILHYGYLPSNTTLDFTVYSTKLDRLKAAID